MNAKIYKIVSAGAVLGIVGSACLSSILVAEEEAKGPSYPPTFVRGDFNHDGSVNITDIYGVFAYLFMGGATPSCMAAADANDDEAVNLTDGIVLINALFRGGPQLPEPWLAVGPDPTPGLPCGPAGTYNAD